MSDSFDSVIFHTPRPTLTLVHANASAICLKMLVKRFADMQ